MKPISRVCRLMILLFLVAVCAAPGPAEKAPSRFGDKSTTRPGEKAAAVPVVPVPPGLRTIAVLPKTTPEVSLIFTNMRNQTCDLLPGDNPLEISSFTAFLLEADKKDVKTGLPNPTTRRPIFSVGIEVGAEDQTKLPKVSAAQILKYLDEHYVSVQARIQKDRGKLYLHHRPIAATAQFGKVRLSQDFTPAVAQSVRDFRAIGLYLPGKSPPIPENLRTAVLVHKHQVVVGNAPRLGTEKFESHYEYVFLRGRPDRIGSKLDVHVFATTEERKKLHYVRTGSAPSSQADCALRGTVFFTRYESGDLIPAESAMRSQSVNSRSEFTMQELDTFVKSNLSLKGDALDNLNEVLDAIIDGDLKPRAGATNAVGGATKTAEPLKR